MESKQDPEIVKEVNALKAFRVHLSVFVIVIGGLWIKWLISGGVGTHAWPAYPTVIWGIFLLIHYIRAYRELQNQKKGPGK